MSSSHKQPEITNVLLQNWDMYRYFLAVIRSGTISGAARLLQESQPTISRRLQEIETALGTRLVERNNSGITLTAAGTDILSHIEAIESQAMEIKDRLYGYEQQKAGRVVIAAPEGFGISVLAPSLVKFRVLHPEIDIELRLGRDKLNLLQREADIAFRVGDPVQSSLVGLRLGDIDFGLYAHTRYLKKMGTPQTVSDLSDHILIDQTETMNALIQSAHLRELAPYSRRVIRSDSMQVMQAGINSGIGIGTLPTYMSSKTPGLVRILPAHFSITEKLWVLTRNELRNIPRIRAAIAYFTEVTKQSIQPVLLD